MKIEGYLEALLTSSFYSFDFIGGATVDRPASRSFVELKLKRIPAQDYDIQNSAARDTKMHWSAVTCGCGDSLPVLHIDWPTIQSKEFA